MAKLFKGAAKGTMETFAERAGRGKANILPNTEEPSYIKARPKPDPEFLNGRDSGAARAADLCSRLGFDPTACYQCGKCTGGCPMAHSMELPPRRIIRCLQTGRYSEALRSPSIWLCASCGTCSERCPNSIPVAEVMEELRHEAYSRGLESQPRVADFNRIFIGNIRLFGRSYEALMQGLYNVESGSLTQDMANAPHMLMHGLVSPLPKPVKNPSELRAIVDRCLGREENDGK